MDRIYESAIDVDQRKETLEVKGVRLMGEGDKGLPCCTFVWLVLLGAYRFDTGGPGTQLWKDANLDGTTDAWADLRAAKQAGLADAITIDDASGLEPGDWAEVQHWDELLEGDRIGEGSDGHDYFIYCVAPGLFVVVQSSAKQGVRIPAWPPEADDGVPIEKIVGKRRFGVARLRRLDAPAVEVDTPPAPATEATPQVADVPVLESGTKISLRQAVPLVKKFARAAEDLLDGKGRGPEKKAWVVDQVLRYLKVPAKERQPLHLIVDTVVALLFHV